jgi:hypothetical protein
MYSTIKLPQLAGNQLCSPQKLWFVFGIPPELFLCFHHSSMLEFDLNHQAKDSQILLKLFWQDHTRPGLQNYTKIGLKKQI